MLEYIANDYVEFSYDKIKWQRDSWRKECQDWLENNPDPDLDYNESEEKDLDKSF